MIRRRGYALIPACAALAAALTACEQVEVTSAEVTTIEVSPPEASVQVNATTKFNATVYGENGVPLTGRQVEWSSLDPNLASVDGNGTVRGLAPGTARIRASAEGAMANATVHITAPPPQIVLSPTSLSFSAQRGGSNPAPRAVQVTASGSGTVNGLGVQVAYPSGQPGGWATATLSGSAAPTTLSVGVTTGTLAAGTYNATVRVESPVAGNSPQNVQVQFVVEDAPARIALSRSSATFSATAGGGNPDAIRIDITNSGGGTVSGLAHSVSYTSGQPTGWLSVTRSGTSAPATLTLNATTGSLLPGSYSANVRLTSSTATNSPVDIPVTFNVGTPSAPAAPSGLAATAVSSTRIDLTWNHNGVAVSRFEVQRSTDGSAYNTIHTTSSGSTRSYSDTGRNPGTRYFYRVRACNLVGCSGWSNVADATTPGAVSEPDVPGNVTATAIGPREVRVSWTAPGGQTEYLVRYRTGTGGRWNDPATVAGNQTSYTQTGLSPNSTYQFQVAACNSAGCSQYSSPATVTTLRPADADSVSGYQPPR
jgi:hypothetical protein